jgi:hypothetical protein
MGHHGQALRLTNLFNARMIEVSIPAGIKKAVTLQNCLNHRIWARRRSLYRDAVHRRKCRGAVAYRAAGLAKRGDVVKSGSGT